MTALCNLQMGINQIAGMKILFPIRTWKSQAIPSPLSLRKFCQDASIFNGFGDIHTPQIAFV
jgi:hypothetical protein